MAMFDFAAVLPASISEATTLNTMRRIAIAGSLYLPRAKLARFRDSASSYSRCRRVYALRFISMSRLEIYVSREYDTGAFAPAAFH